MNWYHKQIFRIAAVCCAISRFFHRFSGKKNILIIANDGLGDLILRLPYLRAIREHFPRTEYSITLWVSPGFIPLASEADVADNFLKLPRRRNRFQWTLFRVGFWLRHSWDMICDMTVLCDPAFWPRYDTLQPYKNAFEVTMTHPQLYPSEKKLKGDFKNLIDISGLTFIERHCAFLAFLEIFEQPQKIDFCRFCRPMPGMPPAGSYFVVCSGSNDFRRRWEMEKFIELIDRLQEHFGLTVVLVGSSGEREFCEDIRNKCGNPERILNFAGKTSILQLFSVIRDAAFLISNDTGSCHVGAALGVQTFIICGLGDYGSFVPYPEGIEGVTVHSIFSSVRVCKPCCWQNELCRTKNVYPCISDITADEVFRQVISHVPEPLPSGLTMAEPEISVAASRD